MAQNNLTLLQIAGVAEQIQAAHRNGQMGSYDDVEVLAALLQALAQVLAGGQPTEILLPLLETAGLTDVVATRKGTQQLTVAPFYPPQPNVSTQTAIKADGSAPATLTFPHAFPTALTAILYGAPAAYSGTDNAILGIREVNDSRTLASVQIYVVGGQPNTTCSVDFLPIGN